MARDYRAEYARRVRNATARGLTPSQARGHPKKGETLASRVTGRRVQGAARRASEARAARQYGVTRPGPPSVDWRPPTPGGTREIVTSDPAVVMAALSQAAAVGKDALVNAVGKGGRGRRGYRSTGRRSGRELLRSLEDAPDLGDAIADMDGDGYGEEFTSYGVYEVKMFA